MRLEIYLLDPFRFAVQHLYHCESHLGARPRFFIEHGRTKAYESRLNARWEPVWYASSSSRNACISTRRCEVASWPQAAAPAL